MDVYLLDGTYELFRHHFAVPSHVTAAGREVAATRGVVGSVLGMLEGGVSHLGFATDHVVESFRNAMWPGYKSSAGMDPVLLQQFPLLEEAMSALGVVVWPMVELEADDVLGAAALAATSDPAVERVYICTPDKDLGQCVRGQRVLQLDRRNRKTLDEAGVWAKFGVAPESIPDYLGLVGDSADGYPGLAGWGAKSAAAVLARFGHYESIPDDVSAWPAEVRGVRGVRLAQTLREQHDLAYLCRDLATLRTDAAPFADVDALHWRGPTAAFAAICQQLEAPALLERGKAAGAKA